MILIMNHILVIILLYITSGMIVFKDFLYRLVLIQQQKIAQSTFR
jgi:hypothetical protein